LLNPNLFIEGIIKQARKNPELIHLLRIDEAFKNIHLNMYMQN